MTDPPTRPPLWPSEFEPLRAEARAAATSIFEMYGTISAPTIQERRAMMASLDVASPAGRDDTLAGVPCRVFGDGSGRATYLHFHGGAMILGRALMSDLANATLAQRLGVDVVSVDYRLAPEHPYPAGPDDCFAVARHLIEADDRPLLTGGESAGAYFAVVTLLRVRDRLGAVDRFRGANLVYGAYDMRVTPTKLGARPTDVPDILTPELFEEVPASYLPGRSDRELADPEVSPLFASLHDLPPALFSVGSADGLLDDSLFMDARWRVFGNHSELAVYPDCIHGFMAFELALAHRARERCASFLAACLDT